MRGDQAHFGGEEIKLKGTSSKGKLERGNKIRGVCNLAALCDFAKWGGTEESCLFSYLNLLNGADILTMRYKYG